MAAIWGRDYVEIFVTSSADEANYWLDVATADDAVTYFVLNSNVLSHQDAIQSCMVTRKDFWLLT